MCAYVYRCPGVVPVNHNVACVLFAVCLREWLASEWNLKKKKKRKSRKSRKSRKKGGASEVVEMEEDEEEE